MKNNWETYFTDGPRMRSSTPIRGHSYPSKPSISISGSPHPPKALQTHRKPSTPIQRPSHPSWPSVYILGHTQSYLAIYTYPIPSIPVTSYTHPDPLYPSQTFHTHPRLPSSSVPVPLHRTKAFIPISRHLMPSITTKPLNTHARPFTHTPKAPYTQPRPSTLI